MTSIVVCAHLVANNDKAKAELFESLKSCCDYATNEQGVSRYVICKPDADRPLDLMVVEEYTNQAAFDSHMGSPPVKYLLTKAGSLLSPETKIYTLTWTPGFLERDDRLPSTSTTGNNRVLHPFVIWAAITDPKQERIDALEAYGRAVIVDSTANEADTIFYADALPHQGSENKDISGAIVCAVEMYATKEDGLRHMERSSVKNLVSAGEGQGSVFELKFFSVVYGFMTKS